ncbi:hypothetical protein H696_06237 [Fonticula alba]|uniref:Uncharacterized protein n=1 Tax=Fonticula alba TaxID=691883 RepID=A0A058Z070_FONAL|nr:hypothetical protein H696_06237 [Fonticula alba]KCV67338.1 hypothetical protein H696_06237 [Fonticula alba]|eukprot:XP_009498260.1 hypothetical protein H696_06237 [Fonticula alba]
MDPTESMFNSALSLATTTGGMLDSIEGQLNSGGPGLLDGSLDRSLARVSQQLSELRSMHYNLRDAAKREILSERRDRAQSRAHSLNEQHTGLQRRLEKAQHALAQTPGSQASHSSSATMPLASTEDATALRQRPAPSLFDNRASQSAPQSLFPPAGGYPGAGLPSGPGSGFARTGATSSGSLLPTSFVPQDFVDRTASQLDDYIGAGMNALRSLSDQRQRLEASQNKLFTTLTSIASGSGLMRNIESQTIRSTWIIRGAILLSMTIVISVWWFFK